MDDDEWEQQRNRSIMAAIRTGRPVFGDTNGVLRFADGDQEDVPDEAQVTRAPMPKAEVRETLWARIKRWF